MRPDSFNKLVASFNSLPGIGKKQSERIAYYIVNEDPWFSEDIEDALKLVRKNIIECDICGNITEISPCEICSDNTRSKKLIIVESPMDVFKFEESASIKPYYHVLNRLVNIEKNIMVGDLNIDKLKERAANYREVIIALSPNLEGIVTANYIRKIIGSDVKVTQLAQGIPLGAAMEYVDEVTLKAALDNRKEVK